MGGNVPTLQITIFYMCEYPAIGRRASIARVFKHMGTAHMPRAYPLVCLMTYMTVRFGFQSLELNKLRQMSPLV